MSSMAYPPTPDFNSSQRNFNAFQRRKIGSLRDNNKLFKILQQFENAGKEEESTTCVTKNVKCFTDSGSAPCSVNSQPNFGQFFTLEAITKKKFPITKEIRTSIAPRRHSEGEAVEKRWNSNALLTDTSLKSNRFKPNCNENWRSTINYDSKNLKVINNSTRTNKIAKLKNYEISKDKTPQEMKHSPDIVGRFASTSPSRDSIQNKEISLLRSVDSKRCSKVQESISKAVDTQNDDHPPPIPRRGLTLPITNIMQEHQPVSFVNKAESPSSKSPTAPKNMIRQDSVKNAIQMYEGLSTKSIKSNKNSRKELLVGDGKRVNLTRKSSKRNSFRSAKHTTLAPESKKQSPATKKTESKSNTIYRHCKEDSGIGLGYPEDLKSPQGIYQSLSSVTTPSDHSDTYDRLNRIHDMVNRIHKGQSSTCAACKAVPIGSVQLSREIGPSVLQVKCNITSPHHHPPCICFSCQHSVFSCSLDTTPSDLDISLENLSFIDQEENLYYNVCCLNKPNCEGWRRSRRRPVCEQNGRLCVVNCDMAQKSAGDDFYEKIFEWNTKRPSRHVSKQISGDSCDSDEGWVDVTDSEDEKTLTTISSDMQSGSHRDVAYSPETGLSLSGHESFSVQNNSFDAVQPEAMYSRLGSENISRAASSEHLYETIGDIDVQISNDSSEKSKVTDNEPDSGEWSTESSSSPTPVEQPCNHSKVENKSSNVSTASSSRFTLASDIEAQNISTKKTFIKSVLGKKSVLPKKRRMSHFFVPWLIANHEYGARSPKTIVKKQGSRSLKMDNGKPARTFTKSQRSQSIPLCTNGTPLSVAKVFSSAEILDRCESDSKELEQISCENSDSSFGLSAESIESLSQRGSVASSTYINADQLHSTPLPARQRVSLPEDSITDVSVEKIFRRSTSGESIHSYIVFQPIKEEEVPLYQFYERNIKERVSLCRSPECLSPIMWSSSIDSNHDCQKASLMRSQLSVVEQLSRDAKDIKMLWCELPEVKESGILVKISAQELKLQEAAFEFIQSQASYIRSLKVLYEHFIQTREFTDAQSSFCVLSRHEHDVLFSDIIIVKEVSERLMAELTNRWSDGILIPDICDIIYKQAVMPSFSIYVKYCSNRVYQERTLKELKETRLCFLEVLRKLESNPACQGLSLESFLFLPMQHIARLPLLLDNIFRWLSSDSPSFGTCKMALEAVHKVFMECNDGARKMERLEEMFILNKQLEFKECKVVPLISASRWLLKKGELMKLEFDKKTFGRSSRCLRLPLYIFLFNDLLVITKRKSEDSYSVLDYCLRDKVQAMAVNAKDLQQPDLVPSNCHYLIYLTLFSNHQGSAVDVILNCTLQSERTRWIEAIHPVAQGTTEVWEHDSPQVQCVRSYIAQQPDELSLQDSDVVTIQRKMNDGWYEGRRLRDGLQGWFPASYTMDIPCSRARASNLRQCYRLLMLSHNHETRK